MLVFFFFDDTGDEDRVWEQLQPLTNFLQLLDVTRQRYPQLTEFILEIDLPLDWDSLEDECVPSGPMLEPEEVPEQLDALLVAIVENTVVTRIKIRWAPTQT